MTDYLKLMAEVRRENNTEKKVRALDAHQIVAWIHDLEDRVEHLEGWQSALLAAGVDNWEGYGSAMANLIGDGE